MLVLGCDSVVRPMCVCGVVTGLDVNDVPFWVPTAGTLQGKTLGVQDCLGQLCAVCAFGNQPSVDMAKGSRAKGAVPAPAHALPAAAGGGLIWKGNFISIRTNFEALGRAD